MGRVRLQLSPDLGGAGFTCSPRSSINQTGLAIKGILAAEVGIAVTSVPFHLDPDWHRDRQKADESPSPDTEPSSPTPGADRAD